MELIAHRGFAARHPENTLRAVRSAAERADWVEVDVRRSADGEPVVIHDATVDRVTDATGPVGDHAAAALAELSVRDSGEGVPTLRAVVDALPDGVGLNAELKTPVRAALDDLRALDRRRVLVSAFEASVLSDVAERSQFDRAYLVGPDENPTAAVETAAELGCAAVHPYHSLVDTPFVDRAHERDLAVNAWTVRERSTADRLRAAGVDGLIADHPDV